MAAPSLSERVQATMDDAVNVCRERQCLPSLKFEIELKKAVKRMFYDSITFDELVGTSPQFIEAELDKIMMNYFLEKAKSFTFLDGEIS